MATSQYSVWMTKHTFRGNDKITSLNINNTCQLDSDMEEAFANCTNLKIVQGGLVGYKIDRIFLNCKSLTTLESTFVFNGFQTSMIGSFQGCESFNMDMYVGNHVTTIDDCFNGCTSLTKFPQLHPLSSILRSAKRAFKGISVVNLTMMPDSLEDLEECFADCKSLVKILNIPTNAINLKRCFYGCEALTVFNNYDPIHIYSNVTNMDETFYNCKNFNGQFIIESENITSAMNCFGSDDGNCPNRDVHIPFNTTTHQAFLNAGYSETERVHGVILLPL